MGIGGIGIWQLVIVLVIILLLFGTKKLRNLGSDLGGALKGFKSAIGEGEDEDKKKEEETPSQLSQNRNESDRDTFDVKAEKVDEKNS